MGCNIILYTSRIAQWDSERIPCGYLIGPGGLTIIHVFVHRLVSVGGHVNAVETLRCESRVLISGRILPGNILGRTSVVRIAAWRSVSVIHTASE